MSELRTTGLTDLHESLGAKLVDYAGWSMPVWYGGATDEHIAVRSTSGLFDLGHMGELIVSGPQAGASLDHALLLQASVMPVGRARYTMICAQDAGIIDDLIVYRLSDDRWMVVANASNRARVYAELLERSTAFDATVGDATNEWGLIALQGPAAAEILQQVLATDVAALRYFRIMAVQLLDFEVLVARTGYTGEDGFELFVPSGSEVDVWREFSVVGAERVRPCGLAARDTLRLEAGMPLYGNELSTDTTPFDVGAGRLFDASRGEVFAYGALQAASARSHRSLVGLHIDGRRPARSGYAVLDRDEGIGVVTSGALSPTLGRPIAIASVETPLEVGASVSIDVRGSHVDAIVVELPFYSRT